jgi:hypothetical protein
MNEVNLPNYYLADLPREAVLSPTMITEACQTLKRNRARYLASRSTQSLIRTIATTAENWLDDEYPFRRWAFQHGPKQTGFPESTLRTGLDSFFRQLTGENLEALLVQEFGHVDRLDKPCASPAEIHGHRAAIAIGPELLVHITGGSIPNPTFTSMVLGLLLRSAQVVKCASGTSFLPRLFAHSLYAADPKLGACLEITEWRGGHEPLEHALFAECQSVTGTGSDETLAAIRRRLPAKVRFVGYGHRVSFGYLSRAALSGWRAKKIVTGAAEDVVAWNQLGCLSPHVFYVEDKCAGAALQFAEMLAEELAHREAAEPRGHLPTEAAATIATRRAMYEVRAAHSPETTRHWFSPGSTAWTVIYEADPRFQLSCLHRFIYVKAAQNLTDALQGADAIHGQVSTVGLAAAEDELPALTQELARWGATRICPLGRMQQPPLTWRHDGRPSLADLVTWAEWEQ